MDCKKMSTQVSLLRPTSTLLETLDSLNHFATSNLLCTIQEIKKSNVQRVRFLRSSIEELLQVNQTKNFW